jgi:hypothetical protein
MFYYISSVISPSQIRQKSTEFGTNFPKAEFWFINSLYFIYKYTKSPDIYSLCVDPHPSYKGGAPLLLISLIFRQMFKLQ